MKVVNAADQEIINHVALVLDRSGSMTGLAKNVVDVVDRQIKTLAQQSSDFNQETRATVYQFGDDIECLYYDRDVNRFSSIKNKYRIDGMTALVSATLKAIEDLQKTATIYGKHTFLVFVVTDGAENASTRQDLTRFKSFMQQLPEEFSVALLVPDRRSKITCANMGYPVDNIEVWDPTAKGLEEVSQKLQNVTRSYMHSKSLDASFKGSKSLFDLNPGAVKKALKKGSLKPLVKKEYRVYRVLNLNHPEFFDRHGNQKMYIKPFYERVSGYEYERGTVFYQPTKPVDVQPAKRVLIRDKATGDVFAGDAARQLLNLPNTHYKLDPVKNPDYDVFIESTSDNRILFAGTDIIYYDE